MLQTMVEYTHPLTQRLWVYMHIPSRWIRKKKNDCKASLLRRTFKGTNTTFLSSFSPSLSIHLLQYTDLAQPEMRTLCELVGTLNVWVSINTPINQLTQKPPQGFPNSTRVAVVSVVPQGLTQKTPQGFPNSTRVPGYVRGHGYQVIWGKLHWGSQR